MSDSSKHDYHLIDAINDGDNRAINAWSKTLVNGTVLYLKARFSAPQTIAEECAQNAFLALFQSIKEKKIKKPEAVSEYIKTTAKHELFKIMKQEKRNPLLENDTIVTEPDVEDELLSLFDLERQKILNACIKKLSTEKQLFITAIIHNNTLSHEDLAEEFGYSLSKCRTLKSRIMAELRLCVNKTKR